jgi:MscS family membrane protein
MSGRNVMIDDITGFRLLGLPAGRIGLAVLVVVLSLAIRMVAQWLLRRISARSSGTAGRLAARMIRPAGALVVLLGLYAAVRILPLSEGAEAWSNRFLLAAAVFSATWILLAGVDGLSDALLARSAGGSSAFESRILPLFRNAAKVLFVVIGVIFLLQTLGYPVGGIVAGLGIGGLAVALAAQDTLSGVFASIAIFLDKPFVVGDYIETAGAQGTVEDIGLRSTRLRTPDRTLVSIPNRKLIEQNIDNWTQRTARRTAIRLSLTAGTGTDAVESLMQDLRDLLAGSPGIERDKSSVYLSGFGEYSLDIEVVFFVTTGDYLEWLGTRSAMSLMILEAVRRRGLELAIPSGTVFLEERRGTGRG